MLKRLKRLFNSRRVDRVVIAHNPALFSLFVELGIARPGDLYLKKALVKDIRGKHVIGHIPIYMAALAERTTIVHLVLPPQYKDDPELPLEVLRQAAKSATTYTVSIEGVKRCELTN